MDAAEDEITVDNFRKQERAWEEGFSARGDEKKLSDNPYPPYPPFREHDAWRDGWKRSAEIEDEAWRIC